MSKTCQPLEIHIHLEDGRVAQFFQTNDTPPGVWQAVPFAGTREPALSGAQTWKG